MLTIKYHYGKFPPKKIDWSRLILLIGPANAALARYDGTLAAIPNASILLSPLMTQEAVLSSKIEGTQATMGEVLEYEAEKNFKDFSYEREADIHEVLNYRKAMWHAIEMLKDLPLCQRVIKEAHQILLFGVRGHGKALGEYRKTSNWIGPSGCTIDEAKFVPISADKLPNAMNQWEKYIHDDYADLLVQLALIHAEFEALHPFLDGNGRLGRMCVPLFMYKAGLIRSPMFYISAFFERNRDEYYDKLLSVSRDDDWTGWCEFFLKAILEQAESNQAKAGEILNLYENKKNEIAELTRSQYAIYALDFIFTRSIFNATSFTGMGTIPTPTAKRILSVLRENNVIATLRESSGRKPAIYAFSELLNITEGATIF